MIPTGPRLLTRGAMLAGVVLASRVLVWSHPLPVHGDDQRFAAGVEFVHRHVLGAPGSGAACDIGVPPAGSYPVHHPGYPLWVLLGTLLHVAGLPPYAALTVLSVAFSVIEPLVLFLFITGLRGIRVASGGGAGSIIGVGDDRASHEPQTATDVRSSVSFAWWLALGYGLSPLNWFYAGTAMCYGAGACIALLTAWCCWVSLGGNRQAWPWALACLAAGAGIRPDLVLWLGPLVVWTGWRRGPRGAILACGVCLAAAVMWPALAGWLYAQGAESAAPRLSHTVQKVLNTSAFRLGLSDGLLRNAVKLSLYLLWTGWPALIAVMACLPAWQRRETAERDKAAVRSTHVFAFVAIWLLPAVLFNLLIHMTEPGHAIWHLAPLAIVAALILWRQQPRRAARIAAMVAVLSAAQFCLYPWTATGGARPRLFNGTIGYVSLRGLKHIDQRGLIHRPGGYWPTRAHDTPD